MKTKESNERFIVWFSCGTASAVTAMCRFLYCNLFKHRPLRTSHYIFTNKLSGRKVFIAFCRGCGKEYMIERNIFGFGSKIIEIAEHESRGKGKWSKK